jgi:hypothetical protein
MQEASVVGLFRTLFILAGVAVLLRFIGRLMAAKRDLSSDADYKREEARRQAEKEAVQKDFGKTRIIPKEKRDKSSPDVEDADFTEL